MLRMIGLSIKPYGSSVAARARLHHHAFRRYFFQTSSRLSVGSASLILSTALLLYLSKRVFPIEICLKQVASSFIFRCQITAVVFGGLNPTCTATWSRPRA